MAKTPPSDTDTSSTVKSPSKSRPVHLLIQIHPDHHGPQIEDLEVFTGEMEARRGLDDRDTSWSYLQLRPGTTYLTQDKS
jgi:hypothetical protein